MGQIIKKDFHFNSSDGIHRIHGILWKPTQQPILGVVQILHGMNEFIDRYDLFAKYLCDQGFVVAGEDHLGHGASVEDDSELGYFAKKDGPRYLVTDNYRLKKHMEQEFANIPYFILGHSMGSFITRNFLVKYSGEIDGAIIMGTGCQSSLMLYASKTILTVMAIFKGWKYRSSFAYNLIFGGYNKKIEEKRTELDWLTRDEAVVDQYLANPLCTFKFTLSAYRDLCDLILNAGKMDNILMMRKDLPVLLMSGTGDPVGDYGRGVKEVCHRFKEADMEDVTLKLYEQCRHELHNETNKEMIFDDLAAWLRHHCEIDE